MIWLTDKDPQQGTEDTRSSSTSGLVIATATDEEANSLSLEEPEQTAHCVDRKDREAHQLRDGSVSSWGYGTSTAFRSDDSSEPLGSEKSTIQSILKANDQDSEPLSPPIELLKQYSEPLQKLAALTREIMQKDQFIQELNSEVESLENELCSVTTSLKEKAKLIQEYERQQREDAEYMGTLKSQIEALEGALKNALAAPGRDDRWFELIPLYEELQNHVAILAQEHEVGTPALVEQFEKAVAEIYDMRNEHQDLRHERQKVQEENMVVREENQRMQEKIQELQDENHRRRLEKQRSLEMLKLAIAEAKMIETCISHQSDYSRLETNQSEVQPEESPGMVVESQTLPINQSATDAMVSVSPKSATSSPLTRSSESRSGYTCSGTPHSLGRVISDEQGCASAPTNIDDSSLPKSILRSASPISSSSRKSVSFDVDPEIRSIKYSPCTLKGRSAQMKNLPAEPTLSSPSSSTRGSATASRHDAREVDPPELQADALFDQTAFGSARAISPKLMDPAKNNLNVVSDPLELTVKTFDREQSSHSFNNTEQALHEQIIDRDVRQSRDFMKFQASVIRPESNLMDLSGFNVQQKQTRPPKPLSEGISFAEVSNAAEDKVDQRATTSENHERCVAPSLRSHSEYHRNKTLATLNGRTFPEIPTDLSPQSSAASVKSELLHSHRGDRAREIDAGAEVKPDDDDDDAQIPMSSSVDYFLYATPKDQDKRSRNLTARELEELQRAKRVLQKKGNSKRLPRHGVRLWSELSSEEKDKYRAIMVDRRKARLAAGGLPLKSKGDVKRNATLHHWTTPDRGRVSKNASSNAGASRAKTPDDSSPTAKVTRAKTPERTTAAAKVQSQAKDDRRNRSGEVLAKENDSAGQKTQQFGSAKAQTDQTSAQEEPRQKPELRSTSSGNQVPFSQCNPSDAPDGVLVAELPPIDLAPISKSERSSSSNSFTEPSHSSTRPDSPSTLPLNQAELGPAPGTNHQEVERNPSDGKQEESVIKPSSESRRLGLSSLAKEHHQSRSSDAESMPLQDAWHLHSSAGIARKSAPVLSHTSTPHDKVVERCWVGQRPFSFDSYPWDTPPEVSDDESQAENEHGAEGVLRKASERLDAIAAEGELRQSLPTHLNVVSWFILMVLASTLGTALYGWFGSDVTCEQSSAGQSVAKVSSTARGMRSVFRSVGSFFHPTQVFKRSLQDALPGAATPTTFFGWLLFGACLGAVLWSLLALGSTLPYLAQWPGRNGKASRSRDRTVHEKDSGAVPDAKMGAKGPAVNDDSSSTILDVRAMVLGFSQARSAAASVKWLAVKEKAISRYIEVRSAAHIAHKALSQRSTDSLDTALGLVFRAREVWRSTTAVISRKALSVKSKTTAFAHTALDASLITGKTLYEDCRTCLADNFAAAANCCNSSYRVIKTRIQAAAGNSMSARLGFKKACAKTVIKMLSYATTRIEAADQAYQNFKTWASEHVVDSTGAWFGALQQRILSPLLSANAFTQSALSAFYRTVIDAFQNSQPALLISSLKLCLPPIPRPLLSTYASSFWFQILPALAVAIYLVVSCVTDDCVVCRWKAASGDVSRAQHEAMLAWRDEGWTWMPWRVLRYRVARYVVENSEIYY